MVTVGKDEGFWCGWEGRSHLTSSKFIEVCFTFFYRLKANGNERFVQFKGKKQRFIQFEGKRGWFGLNKKLVLSSFAAVTLITEAVNKKTLFAKNFPHR